MSQPKEYKFLSLIAGNLKNRPYRSITTIFAFAMIAATLFSAQYLIAGAQQSLDAGMARMGADILVVPEGYTGTAQSVILTGEPSSFFFRDSGFQKISGIPGVAKASPQIYVATLNGASCCEAPVQIIAIDPQHDFTLSPWLKENPGIKMGKDDIIIGSMILVEPGHTTLRFYNHTFNIAGRLERTGMKGIDSTVFTRFEDAYIMADESGVKAVRKVEIPRGMISAVLVKVQPGTSPAEIGARIRSEVPGTKTITPDGLLSTVSGNLAVVTRLLYSSTLAAAVVSIPLLAFLSAMVAHERRREVAILRALGATKSYVVRLMLAESFSLSVIGGLTGIGIASVIFVFFQDYIASILKIPFNAPTLVTVAAIGGSAILLCIVVGGISSLYPAILIGQSEPYETIRRGEQ